MNSLPEIKRVAIPPHPFPTDWQAVIFRNYGKAPVGRIAAVLCADAKTVRAEAERLGLKNMSYDRRWRSRGYLTLLRQNWFLLDYDGLLKLTGMTEKELARTLKEDDFFSVKLGGFKPFVIPPAYSPLSDRNIAATARLAEEVTRNRSAGVRYFDLYGRVPRLPRAEQPSKLRLAYNYGAVYGDILATGDLSCYSDELLSSLAAAGVNALWIHIVLYEFYFPFDPSYAELSEIRLKNLNRLITRLARHGIKLWLYLNEPRGMPLGFFDAHPQLKGAVAGDAAAMCTSVREVREFLYSSVKKIAAAAPDLGGFFTITGSENLTHCLSRPEAGKCDLCAGRAREEIVAEINEIIFRAVKDSGSGAKTVAWTWGWAPYCGWNDGQTERAVRLLPEGMGVMCVSEEALELDKGGVSVSVLDYSLSNPGPSDRTRRLLRTAGQSGHGVYVKLQLGNSWECAAVPYLPCFELVMRHLDGAMSMNADGIMLSWTLGGYPSFNLYLAAVYGKNFNRDSWYSQCFGEDACKVRTASGLFSEAFGEFPFCVDVLYFAPQNFGPANLFYDKPTGFKASMIGFPFDDVDGWRGEYPAETMLDQFARLCKGWAAGVAALESVSDGNAIAVKRIAQAALCHFDSVCNHLRWYLYRDRKALDLEYEDARTLIKLQAEDAAIGFEASNHYFYTENTLLEKLLNLRRLAAGGQ